MQTRKLGVLVPLVAVRTLDEPDIALRKPARQQTLPAEIASLVAIEPVQFSRDLGFLFDFECFRSLCLHSKCQLEGLNPGLKLRIAFSPQKVAAVHLLHHIQLVALVFGTELLADQVLDGFLLNVVDLETCVPYGRSLVSPRQET